MPHPPDSSSREGLELDPVFLNSRREAWIVLGVWLASMLWAVPCCYLLGYRQTFDPQSFRTVLGLPSWVFWGIGFPWIVADVFTTWFCLCYMANDDLGEAHEGADLQEDLAAQQASGQEGR